MNYKHHLVALDDLDRWASGRLHRARLGVLDYVIVLPGMAFGSYLMPLSIGVLALLLGWRAFLQLVVTRFVSLPIYSYSSFLQFTCLFPAPQHLTTSSRLFPVHTAF